MVPGRSVGLARKFSCGRSLHRPQCWELCNDNPVHLDERWCFYLDYRRSSPGLTGSKMKLRMRSNCEADDNCGKEWILEGSKSY